MTQTAHTPGPWVFRKEALYEGAVEDNYISAQGKDIMGDPPYYPFCPDEDADWNLIAAAPDLLEALEEAVTILKKHGYFAKKQQAAIARAKGGAQ